MPWWFHSNKCLICTTRFIIVLKHIYAMKYKKFYDSTQPSTQR